MAMVLQLIDYTGQVAYQVPVVLEGPDQLINLAGGLAVRLGAIRIEHDKAAHVHYLAVIPVRRRRSDNVPASVRLHSGQRKGALLGLSLARQIRIGRRVLERVFRR